VLSSELDLCTIDARHWKNWWRLLVPPRVLAPARWALAILDRGALVQLIVRGEGARELVPLPGLPEVSAKALASYARTLGVAAVVVVERRLLAELSAEIEGALQLDQDLVAQGLIVLRALKRHAGRGVWTEPALLDLLPAPSYEAVQRTFDLLVPDRSAMVAYVIDDDRRAVHASIIAVKAGGDVTRAATHRAIADLVPEASFARDWETGHRRVLTAVEDRFARPSIALFAERATVLAVLTGPSDQLARELNAGRVVIDPAPAWLLGLLGGAAVAALAGRAATALAGMLPQSTRDRASALASRARDAIKDSGAHPFALLGFDPLELWARLKHYYQP
jgi:antitoxin (DNA-binding transcriptional repressor) of toxin-antitoxin stability system